MLPKDGWEQYWDRILVPADIKERLYNYARFTLSRRGSFSIVGLPVHGIALIRGLPGTGKSSLVKGLANKLASELGDGELLFAEVNAHALPSQMLGDSQRNTINLLERALPELADKGHPVVVLIDEIDSIATDRDRASSGTDPVDVARATEAALQGLDHLAAAAPNMVIIGTSNFPQAIDPAFLSRLDLTIEIELPDQATTRAILSDVLAEVGSDIEEDEMTRAAKALEGSSGRDIRKVVFEALVSRDASISIEEPLRAQELWSAIEARMSVGNTGESP
jgi:SpoVK/Ycf46/Vps4 family AAA+-type ATPase